MHIKITSVATEEIGPVLGRVAVAMEDALNPLFEQKSYGDIDQFMAVVVAVDSDVVENSRFVAATTDRKLQASCDFGPFQVD